MSKPKEIASVLISKSDSVCTVAQARRVAIQKGFVVRHGVQEQTNYFRVPQEGSEIKMINFKTSKRKVGGVKIVRGEFL